MISLGTLSGNSIIRIESVVKEGSLAINREGKVRKQIYGLKKDVKKHMRIGMCYGKDICSTTDSQHLRGL